MVLDLNYLDETDEPWWNFDDSENPLW
jgi:hypothetical protein